MPSVRLVSLISRNVEISRSWRQLDSFVVIPCPRIELQQQEDLSAPCSLGRSVVYVIDVELYQGATIHAVLTHHTFHHNVLSLLLSMNVLLRIVFHIMYPNHLFSRDR
jgi:hypothetical protein